MGQIIGKTCCPSHFTSSPENRVVDQPVKVIMYRHARKVSSDSPAPQGIPKSPSLDLISVKSTSAKGVYSSLEEGRPESQTISIEDFEILWVGLPLEDSRSRRLRQGLPRPEQVRLEPMCSQGDQEEPDLGATYFPEPSDHRTKHPLHLQEPLHRQAPLGLPERPRLLLLP